MRDDKLVIRLTQPERRAIEALARAERLPPSTLARRLLLREVDRRGLWPPGGYDDRDELSRVKQRPASVRGADGSKERRATG